MNEFKFLAKAQSENIIVKNIVDWQFNRKLRDNTISLLIESMTKDMDNVVDSIEYCLESSNIGKIYEHPKTGKRSANQEYLRTFDDLYTQIVKNQDNL